MSRKIQTFVFMDLETTGLPQYEFNRTKIIELCMIAVEANHLQLGTFPRAHNKLSMCFNPNKMISVEAAQITGLSNELLEDKSKFSKETVQIIQHFLDANPKPICLVAHNGDRFDFPIFSAEIFNAQSTLEDNLLCIDSLTALRALEKANEQPRPIENPIPFEFHDNYDETLCQIADELEDSIDGREKKMTPMEIQKINETTPKKNMISNGATSKMNRNLFGSSNKSYKLAAVYNRLTCNHPVMEHQAEGDVIMMLTCCAVFAEKFVDYACEKSRKFNDVPRMQPGRSLGR